MLSFLKKQWFNLLKILISAGLLIYLLFFKTDLGQLLQILRKAAWGYLALAALLMIAGTALRAVRWQVLLNALDIHVPLPRLVGLYFVGAFFNIFMPSGLGGDAVKMVELSRSTGKVPEAIGTTLVDRAVGLWVLFVMALVALPFSYQFLPPQSVPEILVIILAGVMGGWLAMGTPLIPWLGDKIRLPGQEKLTRFYRSISQLGYAALGKACLVSLVFNLMLILFNILIAYGLEVYLPVGIFLLFVPIISFSLALPISIGGLGVREQAYVLLFGTLGISSATSVALGLTNWLITNLIVGLLGGIWYSLEGARELASRKGQV